ncbi:MAG: ribonuclease HII [Rhodospirillales bacterium]|nr:ribonuclease HII [Rhodospirillales bacterium]
MPDFAFEKKLGGLVAGIDEAGRGPLAGPVVAAAVAFRHYRLPAALTGGIDDSKKLTPAQRIAAFAELATAARAGDLAFGIGAASVAEIDRINILQATFLAMRRAVGRLGLAPDVALVDGNRAPPDLGCRAMTLVDGDATSLSIAAASIVAKVIRDRAMHRLDPRYPGFGWATNMGYGTVAHIEGIARLGPTPHHRLSFAPLAQGRLGL